MVKKITKLTPEQIARFGEWSKQWIDIGLSTEPADFDKATEAALRGYALANLKKPMVILRMSSPYGAVLGGALAWAMLRELGAIKKKVRPQVGSQVRSQVGSQVGSQVWSQVGPQVGSQVRSQVGSQVGSQVESQVWSQVGSQVRSQVGSQVRSQVWSQVGSQVWSQVGPQVGSQVWSQVGPQVGSQVESQVWSQVGSQVGSQVWSQVGPQVGSQVESQVWSQVGSQVESQVWSQVGSQVWSQVGSQVWSQVESQVGSQVESQVGSQVESQVGSQVWSQRREAYYNSYHGSLYASWGAYVSFFRDVCDWDDPVLERFEIDEALIKNCGWVWWHENVLAISDRPTVINRDNEGRLHCETGPSIAYRDGWQLHHWHGTSVPAEWIEDRNSLTATVALKQENVEQRRAACEILGWANILRDLNAKTIDHDDDPQIGDLVAVKLPDLPQPAKFLRVQCGTGREFAIGIPPHINKALDAQAWIVGLDPKDFQRPEVRA